MEQLELPIPAYSRLNDPITARWPTEWTILDTEVQSMRRVYEKTCCKGKKKKPIKEKITRFKKIKKEDNLDEVKYEDIMPDIKTEIKFVKTENLISSPD